MYRKFRLTALATALVAAAAPAAAEDLLQIYEQARQADPTFAMADAGRIVADGGADAARATLLPQISASLNYLHADGTQRSVGPLINQDTGLPVTDNAGNVIFESTQNINRDRSREAQGQIAQSLFNWANIERWRSARATLESAGSDYDAAAEDLIVRTATAYFAVLTSEDQLAFAQANEKALARQLDQAEQRYQVGLSAITDVHEARANHDTARAQVITAQNNVDNAREAITQITGKSFGELKKLREQLPLEKPEPAELQTWVDTALKQSPLIASKAHALDAARLNVETQRAGHYPTLSASLVRTDTPAWSNTTRISGTDAFGPFHGNGLSGDTTFGVTLNVPIFTGGLLHAQVHQAIGQRDIAQDQAELTRRSVVAGTRNAYRAVIAGISEVEATKQAVISAQSALDATQAGFEVGTRTIVDVLLSQQQLFQAQSQYSQARHQFVLSGLQLKQAAGVVAAKDLAAVNSLLE
jgi:outer membrane protein